MTTCEECGQEFRTLTSAWGDAVCGECLQARIDRTLASALPLGERKPLRRAGTADATPALPDVRKAANE